jgi:hypothetical protein
MYSQQRGTKASSQNYTTAINMYGTLEMFDILLSWRTSMKSSREKMWIHFA